MPFRIGVQSVSAIGLLLAALPVRDRSGYERQSVDRFLVSATRARELRFLLGRQIHHLFDIEDGILHPDSIRSAEIHLFLLSPFVGTSALEPLDHRVHIARICLMEKTRLDANIPQHLGSSDRVLKVGMLLFSSSNRLLID